MRIGVIGAMQIEVDNLKASMSDISTKEYSGVTYVCGTIGDKEVVAAVCGIGKVFAAICAEAMILEFHVDYVINIGVGGTLCKERARALHRANKILTVVIFVAYPCLLLWLLWQKDMRLYKAICVPLDGFIIVTVVRVWINRKRPYEIFELPSVIPKDTKGHSWPSRHVFSAAVIAFTFWFVCPAVGIVFLLMTVAIAWIRVVSGVHFISDVVAGFLFAAFFSLFF